MEVALVEIGGSHDECLYSQLFALKAAGCTVHLVCTEALRQRNPHFETYTDAWKIVETRGKALEDLQKMKRLNRYFREQGIEKVILNTAQGGHIRNLCLYASRRSRFYGIIHTLRKFEGSFTQRIINRKVKDYLVLNDTLLKQVHAPELRIDSFYPLRYPHFEGQVPKGAKYRIALIGGVENRRKDLEGFVRIVRETRHLPLEFVFLGKSDSEHIAGLDPQDADRIVSFRHFLDHETFDAYLQNTDVILPLVHPGTDSAREYFRNQISGALNVAFAYRIPLLVHQAYSGWEDLKHTASFYTMDRISDNWTLALEHLPELKKAYGKLPKLTAEVQEEKYLRFLGIAASEK